MANRHVCIVTVCVSKKASNWLDPLWTARAINPGACLHVLKSATAICADGQQMVCCSLLVMYISSFCAANMDDKTPSTPQHSRHTQHSTGG